MSQWRTIDTAAFAGEFAAVRERLFDPRHWEAGDSPFLRKDWRIVPIPCCPFYGDEPGAQRPEDFPPIEPYFADYYDPLYLTLAELGVDEVAVSKRAMSGGTRREDGCLCFSLAWDFGAGGEEHRLVQPTAAAFRAVEFGGEGLANYTAFSRDGQWGLVIDDDEFEYGLLGGGPEFIERFYRFAGGEINVCKWFTYFVFCQNGGGFGRDRSDDLETYLKTLYAQAGWPLPNRWWAWQGEDLDWSWMMDDEGFPPASPKGKSRRKRRR